MKIALVLCGGGSLGSYEIGAIKKLVEKGIKFDIVTGTSIGALNGYFVATEQFEKAIELWETIKNDDVFRWGVENRGKAISDAFLNRDRKNPVNQTVAMLGSLAFHQGIDNKPYIETLSKMIDPTLIKKSPIKMGLIYTTFPGMKEQRAILNQVNENRVLDYLFATSACFPVFPPHKIAGKNYIDGGWTNNLPIDFAFDLGADYVYAIMLHSFPYTPQKPEYFHLPNVTLIEQSQDMGMMMDFDRKRISNNIALGYLDCGRVLGDFKGKRYAFRKEDVSLEAHKFVLALEKNHLTGYKEVLSLLSIKDPHPSEEDLYFAALEHLAKLYNISPYRAYSVKEMECLLEERIASYVPKDPKKPNALKFYLKERSEGKEVPFPKSIRYPEAYITIAKGLAA